MSQPKLPFDLPLDQLRISVWTDPVVDAVGHDARSAYVERFWLPILGPSTTLLVRRMAAELDAHPEGFDLPLEATAHAMGLGLRGGVTGPFFRALARTGQFGITRPVGPAELATRPRLQSLTHAQVRRLPPHLQVEHTRWLSETSAEPDLEERRKRARLLALSLLELGEPPQAVEVQLHRWKIHPALAHEALRWAVARQPRPAQGLADDAA